MSVPPKHFFPFFHFFTIRWRWITFHITTTLAKPENIASNEIKQIILKILFLMTWSSELFPRAV